MIKKITLFTLLIFSLSIFSQTKIKGNGTISNIKTDLTAFNKIIIKNNFKVTLIKSDTPSIEIETDENLHEFIDFNVADSVFILKTDNRLKSKKTLNITLFFTNSLNKIAINDDSQIETLTTIKVPELSLNINDYSKADLHIKSDNFSLNNKNKSKIQLNAKTKLNIESTNSNLSFAGSSDTEIIIKTDNLQMTLNEKANLDITGSSNELNLVALETSDCKGKNLNVRKAKITTKGSSEISTHVFESLTIEASEKSKIEVYGNPVITLETFTNSAKLHKKELVNK